VQALHGLIIDGAMVSIFLPPNWHANSGEIYPVIASSTYDLNATVFSKSGEIALNERGREFSTPGDWCEQYQLGVSEW
jgi:hypothetical protein